MEMKWERMESFESPDEQLVFQECYAFSKGKKHLLLGENGNMILINESIYQHISNKKLDDDIWFKLLQRRLAIHKEHDISAQLEDVLIRPTYFMIDMTSRCNMGCKYCLRDGENPLEATTISNEMVVRICNYIAEYCKKNKLEQIYIQPWGGEPLLEKDKIFLIQDEMERRAVHANITIETNGLLLSDSLIRELYGRDIGYGISIDGFAGVHDGQRTLRNGMGTHQRVEQAVKKTKEYYGEDTSILATVTKQSIPYMKEIIEYFAGDLGLNRIKLNFVHKSVFQQEDEFCVDIDDIKTGTEQIFDTIVSLNEKNVDIMEYNLWVKVMNILTNRKIDACISRGCSGGRSMIVFDTKGDIFPCDVTDFPDEKIGSISDDRDLNELVEKAERERSYFTKKESDECAACPWKHFCQGGCTVHVKCAGGEPGTVDRIECTVNRMIYPKIIELTLDKPELVNRMLGYEIL